jgi:HEPN domain
VSWQPGKQDVLSAINSGELQRVTGGQAAGSGWITDANRKLQTATNIAAEDPATAYVTAYDAARFALVGVLAQQGLRATQRGGHLAVEQAMRAQFGQSFADFSTLRRRRAELEYPAFAGEAVEDDEVADALAKARRIIDGAAQLLPSLGIFN